MHPLGWFVLPCHRENNGFPGRLRPPGGGAGGARPPAIAFLARVPPGLPRWPGPPCGAVRCLGWVGRGGALGGGGSPVGQILP